MPLDAQLRLAYEKAHYVVACEQDVLVRIGEPNAALDALVSTTAAYVTGANPRSRVRSALENDLAHGRLRSLVAPYASLAAESRDPVRQFPPERGLLVLGIALADAMAIGRVLGQNAIVFIAKGRAPELVVLV